MTYAYASEVGVIVASVREILRTLLRLMWPWGLIALAVVLVLISWKRRSR